MLAVCIAHLLFVLIFLLVFSLALSSRGCRGRMLLFQPMLAVRQLQQYVRSARSRFIRCTQISLANVGENRPTLSTALLLFTRKSAHIINDSAFIRIELSQCTPWLFLLLLFMLFVFVDCACVD